MPSDRSAFPDSPPDPETPSSDTGSVRPEASTVYRAGLDSNAVSSSDTPPDLAEAHTVIRRSSRIGLPQPNRTNQPSPPTRDSPAMVAKVLVGSQLGKFHIDRLIGGGGMGAVFLAQDEALDRPVAIKVIPYVEEDPDLQRRFRNECQLVAKLDHPKIARVYDTGSHGQWHFIVFEYVEGVNIRNWITQNGPMTIDDAVFYTAELADALEHLASRGIVHRDVKPSNILLSPDGSIKLVDLGLARSDHYDFTDDMTASGVTLGTFDYISPEQAKDARAADLRSDIYSLGCTLYFMLTGRPPYPGGSMMNKLMSHSNQPPPDPRGLRPEVSSDLAKLLAKMMAKKVNQRYQTGNDLVADLRWIAVRNGLSRATGLPPVAAANSNPFLRLIEKHLPWATAIGLVFMIAVWFHLDGRDSRDEIKVPPTAKRLPIAPQESGEPSRNVLPGADPRDNFSTIPARASQTDPFDKPIVPRPVPVDASETRMPSSEGSTMDEQPLLGNSTPALVVITPHGLASDSESASPMRDRSPIGINDRSIETDLPTMPASDDLETDRLQGVSVELLAGRLVDSFGNDFVPTVVRVVAGLKDHEMRRLGDEELHVQSLADALMIASLYQLETIDLACVSLVTPPLTVSAENLKLESSVGGTLIRFEAKEVVSLSRPVMFELGKSRIEFEGIHFAWVLPEEEQDGGTMFELNAGGQAHLIECTITIDNAAFRDEVYAFDIVTAPDRFSDPNGQHAELVDSFPLVAIDLADVVIRGQMTMLHMDYASKLWLDWDNGLLAITERMIDTAGARLPVPPSSGPIKISFSRVTTHAAKGICRVRLGVDGAYPFMINRTARSSVFMVDPAFPHFEVINFPTSIGDSETSLMSKKTGASEISDSSRKLGDARVPLRLDGSSNAYVVQPARMDPLVRVSDSNGGVWSVPVKDLASNNRSWIDENLPIWRVLWTSPPAPQRAMNTLQPSDYRQEGKLTPGFEEKSLPIPPVPLH